LATGIGLDTTASTPLGSVDRYQLHELVGTGGMSRVYRAWDRTLDREVAVKLLHPHLAGEAESRLRFSREARAVAKLRHPNILEIFDFSGEPTQPAYIVTEFIHGETLRSFAERAGFALPSLGALCAHALAEALEHAHALGIVHRDLKPENVMVGPDGQLKLMDFGIARFLDQGERMTMTGALIGSPAHMAPELIEGKEADARSDLFSLGTLLYWMLTGSLPFQAANTTALLKKILDVDYRDPRLLNRAVSDSLAECVRSLLKRDPADRPESAHAVRVALEAALAEDGLIQPDEDLRDYLKDPQGTQQRFRQALKERLLSQARESLSERRFPRVLKLADRLLALEPDEPEARALVRAVSERERRRRRLIALGKVGAACVALAVLMLAGVRLAVWIRSAVGHGTLPNTVATTRDPVAETTLATTASPLRQVGDPSPEQAPSDGPSAAPRHAALRAHVPPPKPQPLVPGTLSLRIFPYADVSIDGRAMENGVTERDYPLSPGPHELTLKHPYSQPWSQRVEIESGKALSLPVKLTPLPARLKIDADPRDANVMVDGVYKGTAFESFAQPILIPLLDSQSSRLVRVRLFKNGYADDFETVQVNANGDKYLHVKMSHQ
jgi:serine/threonine-protein kinase